MNFLKCLFNNADTTKSDDHSSKSKDDGAAALVGLEQEIQIQAVPDLDLDFEQQIVQQQVSKESLPVAQQLTKQLVPSNKKTAVSKKKAPVTKKKAAPTSTMQPRSAFRGLLRQESSVSTTFSKTKFAAEWKAMEVQVHGQIGEISQQVDLDDTNAHAWTLFFKVTDPAMERYIESVTFKLHPSFVPSTVKQSKAPFELSKVGWGYFECGIEVKLIPNCSLSDINKQHLLDFTSPKTESLETIELTCDGNAVQMQFSYGNTYELVVADQSSENQLINNLVKSRNNRLQKLKATELKLVRLKESNQAINEFILSFPEHNKQRIALGAVMVSAIQGTLHRTDEYQKLLATGMSQLRYVLLEDKVIAEMQREPSSTASTSAYNLSHPVQPGDEIDVFVSHCWMDDVATKVAVLTDFRDSFVEKYNRAPKLWLDRFCINQEPEHVASNVVSLPLFLLACKSMLLLYSQQLTTRLWCLTELYTATAMSQAGDVRNEFIQLVDVDRYGREAEPNIAKTVSVLKANTSVARDKELLFENLSLCPGGLTSVDKLLNEAVSALVE